MVAPFTVLAVGDLILEEPHADGLLEPTRALLQSGDVVIGHVETPFTNEGVVSTAGFPAPASPPERLEALARAGFHAASLAGNHIFDQGMPGVRDTAEALTRFGVAPTGAGMNLEEAQRPAIVQAKGRRVGVLSYNTVGPRESWATGSKAGAAYIRTLTHYDLQFANPGGAPKVYTFCDPEDLDAFCAQVERTRAETDLLVVALHKGAVGVNMTWYEKQLTHAAVEAGADIVVGHHPHSLRGVEIYKGRPIFHGLGNFAAATRAFSGKAANKETSRTKAYYSVGSERGDDAYPFREETRHSMIAKCLVDDAGRIETRFIPCYIEGPTWPAPREGRGEAVLDYVRTRSQDAGFKSTYAWDGDEVVVSSN